MVNVVVICCCFRPATSFLSFLFSYFSPKSYCRWRCCCCCCWCWWCWCCCWCAIGVVLCCHGNERKWATCNFAITESHSLFFPVCLSLFCFLFLFPSIHLPRCKSYFIFFFQCLSFHFSNSTLLSLSQLSIGLNIFLMRLLLLPLDPFFLYP